MAPKNTKRGSGKSPATKKTVRTEEGPSTQSRIDGVNVIPQNWESSASATAGLLGLKDTDALREFTTNPHFLGVYNSFADARRNYFGLTGETDAAKGKAASVTDKKVFKFAHDTHYHGIIRQTEPITPSSSSDVPDSHIAPLNWLNAITRIAIANPQMFHPDDTGSYSNEDLYRILQAIRWKWKGETNSRQGKGHFQNNPAIPPTYYTDTDDPRGEHEFNLTTVKDSEVPGFSLAPVNQPLDDDEPAQPDHTTDTAPPVAPDSDFLDVFGNFVESIPANRDLEGGARPKLNPSTLRQTLEILSQQIKVTYDSRTTSGTADQGYVSSAMALEVVSEEDGTSTGATQSKEFWELQGKLNRTCAPLPAYESACDLLGLDRYTPTLPGEGGIVLKPWQVVGIAWMIGQEDGPVKGGIVADDCGLGKTVLALALVHFAASRPREMPYRPTVVVVPPGIVDTWIQEWRQHFQKTIKLLLFHGARSQTPDLIRESLIVENKDFNNLLAGLKDDDPSTLTTVILTTYSTWHMRSLVTVDVEEEDVSEDDDEEPSQGPKKKKTKTKLRSIYSGMFDRVICDEGHKVKNFGTNAHKAIHLIRPSYAWFLTATPMINRVHDLRGYLAILWKQDWQSDVTWDDAVSAYKSFTGDEPVEDRLFLLDPKLFGRLSKKGVMDTANAYAALPRILELIQMRRSMASILTTVKGNTIRIGDTIPAYDVTTVELEMTRKEQDEFNRFFTPLIDRLVRNSSSTDAEESEGGAHFDMTSYRRLCHLSYSTSLERLYKATSGKNTVTSINKWHEYRDHGLTWFMNKVKTDYAMPVIRDRSTCAFYMANTCPKLRYLAKILLEKVLGENRRVLVFAEWPMTQWHVEMFLVVLGIRTLSLRSRHSDEERTVIANHFNDPNFKVDVLITTYRTCSVGINLHKACHDVVMLEPAINANTILQSIGRVHRLGQKERQEIDILFVDHTFNRHVEHNQAKKMISQIVGQGKGVFGDVIERNKDAATAADDENEDSDAEETEKEENANMDIVRKEGDKILQKMLGQCRSRLEWDDPKDLGFSTSVTRGKGTLLDRGQGQSVSTRTRQSTLTKTRTDTKAPPLEADVPPMSSVPIVSPQPEIPSSPVQPITSSHAAIASSSATQLPKILSPLAEIVQDSGPEYKSSDLSSPPHQESDVTVQQPNPEGNGGELSLQTNLPSQKRPRTPEDEGTSDTELAESGETATAHVRRSKRLQTSKN